MTPDALNPVPFRLARDGHRRVMAALTEQGVMHLAEALGALNAEPPDPVAYAEAVARMDMCMTRCAQLMDGFLETRDCIGSG